MGFLSDILKKVLSSSGSSNNGSTNKKPAFIKKSETFTFNALPTNLAELKVLPEAALDTPFKTAALAVCALNVYSTDPDTAIEMLNFLKGPQPLTPFEKQFLHDRFAHQNYIPISYFKGAVPSNNYTPSTPFTITVEDNPYSYDNAGYAVLYLSSGGADNARQIKLRQKGDGQWFLWEQLLLTDIRKKQSEDPWA